MHSLRMILLAAALVAPPSACALPLPESVVREFPKLRMAGEGRLRWFGLLIYDASLWTEHGQWEPGREFALHIRYAREIKGSRLAEASIDEMRRLGFGTDAQRARWGGELARMLPDVRKGQFITGVNLPGMGVRFYHQGQQVGAIADTEFASGFFGIWLDERTREPRLRQALFGGK